MYDSVTPMDWSMPGFPVLHHLLELAQTDVCWISDAINYLILYCPLLLLPSVSPSITVFANKSTLCIRWPKYWSFTFSICPSNEYSGLISFRIDWLDLLAIQGTLKSVLQHHSSKGSILQHSAFFIVQLLIEINHLEPCLVHSKYCVYKTPNTVWLKWQNIFSHSPGSYKSEIKR